ncbi:hypothetical protein [Spirosoma sp. KNUC1025]|uniref:hypothetical protein n=1 Tax=Spirosoma sp. KNUC1025 TaxID=2894082 RepID=UPI00386C81C8|nr:hypothetical protein LN737_00610 [Spirosoma sp. KNUC1025]
MNDKKCFMESIVVLPAQQLKEIIDRYETAAVQLIEAQKELAALKDDKYVTWEWICDYFGVTKPTAVAMLSHEKVFVFGQKVKRLKRSAVLRFAERNSIRVKDIEPLPHQKRARIEASSHE